MTTCCIIVKEVHGAASRKAVRRVKLQCCPVCHCHHWHHWCFSFFSSVLIGDFICYWLQSLSSFTAWMWS